VNPLEPFSFVVYDYSMCLHGYESLVNYCLAATILTHYAPIGPLSRIAAYTHTACSRAQEAIRRGRGRGQTECMAVGRVWGGEREREGVAEATT